MLKRIKIQGYKRDLQRNQEDLPDLIIVGTDSIGNR